MITTMVWNSQNGQLRSQNQINLSETYLTRRPVSVRTPKWRVFTFTIQSFADREDGGVSHMAVLPPLPLYKQMCNPKEWLLIRNTMNLFWPNMQIISPNLHLLAVFTTAIWHTFGTHLVQIRYRFGQIRFSASLSSYQLELHYSSCLYACFVILSESIID